MLKFAKDRCDQCDANLVRKKPGNVIEVKPHPGEPGIEEWSYSPCPSCGSAVPVAEPEPVSEPESGKSEVTEPED